MTELDVIVIHSRGPARRSTSASSPNESCRVGANTSTGRLHQRPDLPHGVGTDRRENVARYIIAVEVPSHAEHREHDADPEFHEFNRLALSVLMSLQLAYLAVLRVFGWLALLACSDREGRRDPVLRHQIAVPQRQVKTPKLSGLTGRSWPRRPGCCPAVISATAPDYLSAGPAALALRLIRQRRAYPRQLLTSGTCG